VVVFDVEDLDPGAVSELPVGDVGLPAFVGLRSGEPVPGALRPLLCGVTKPRRVKTRQIVETAGTGVRDVEVFDLGVRPAARVRWVWMVSAPASRPCLDSSLRSRRIWSSTAAGTAFGLLCGRRDRGS
jgi:hypothetical protein